MRSWSSTSGRRRRTRRATSRALLNLPVRQIRAETLDALPEGRLAVVYCWGPGCNGATKAAARLSALGVPVKEMIGGIEYWRREGYAVEGSDVEGAPLVG